MITRRKAKIATREENSEEFEINNQMGMEQSEDRNVVNEESATKSEENGARGPQSSEVNFQMLMSFMKQNYQQKEAIARSSGGGGKQTTINMVTIERQTAVKPDELPSSSKQ